MSTPASIGVAVATVWRGPDTPRAHDAPAVADVPDLPAWTEALLGEPASNLWGRTDTQALLGEPVEVVAEEGDWARVVLPWQPSSADPDGYPGWVRRAHLADPLPPGDARMVVRTPTATIGEVVASYATILPVADADGDHVRVALPGGAVTVAVGHDIAHLAPGDPGPSSADLIGAGRQFLGLRYLWGGTCGWGMDCSGFVHLTHRAYGVRVPRDAFDQAAVAAAVELTDAWPGALYFFARPGRKVHHVGYATGDDPVEAPTILHAPDSETERIEDAPLTPKRRETLVSAGTFLNPA